jgi:SAM-dependent methyltransferase
MLDSGLDAVGVEKHEGMRAHAQQLVESPERVLAGGVEALKAIPGESFDVVLMMGVLQYLSDDDFAAAVNESKRILKKPGGVFYATFQNALFDLFTFNKYTVDFFMHGLCGPHLKANERQPVECAIRKLVTNPAAPAHAPARARDNVFVRLSNPLTIASELKRDFGLVHRETNFYEWFGLPPLLGSEFGPISKRIGNELSRDPTAWQGTFMANAFLASFGVR